MKAVIITDTEFKELTDRLDSISEKLESNNYQKHTFVDNQEFIKLMGISKRTAQTWRDEGKISFSQIGSKIYYQISDIDIFLIKNYNKSFYKR